MRFGLFGSAAARRGSGEFDSAEGFEISSNTMSRPKRLGFHGTFVVEHHFTGFGQVSATLSLLTWLGARTNTLRLGTAVMVLPWHNPVLLAEQAATLDLLSGGRLDFGIGTGYRYNEFARLRRGNGPRRARIRKIDRRDPESLDIRSTLLAQRQILDVQRYHRRAAAVSKAAPGGLDGSRQRPLDPRRRAARFQSVARPIRLARRRRAQHRGVPRGVEANGEPWDPMRVGVTRAFFVSDSRTGARGSPGTPVREPDAAIEAGDRARRHGAWRSRPRPPAIRRRST